MIHGIGIEIIDVDRFFRVMERRGERFLKRLFTADELDYCMRKRRPEERLAARFAAKKSFMKAVGKTVNFLDMEIRSDVDGRPTLHVNGLDDSFRIVISLSHDKGLAIAQAIVYKLP
ncbi:MAG: holo-ACP synthase [Deltaproteobacteria bacterium]|nr:holo-ACP synthase [Deltaproteobacteria bacterium]